MSPALQSFAGSFCGSMALNAWRWRLVQPATTGRILDTGAAGKRRAGGGRASGVLNYLLCRLRTCTTIRCACRASLPPRTEHWRRDSVHWRCGAGAATTSISWVCCSPKRQARQHMTKAVLDRVCVPSSRHCCGTSGQDGGRRENYVFELLASFNAFWLGSSCLSIWPCSSGTFISNRLAFATVGGLWVISCDHLVRYRAISRLVMPYARHRASLRACVP